MRGRFRPAGARTASEKRRAGRARSRLTGLSGCGGAVAGRLAARYQRPERRHRFVMTPKVCFARFAAVLSTLVRRAPHLDQAPPDQEAGRQGTQASDKRDSDRRPSRDKRSIFHQEASGGSQAASPRIARSRGPRAQVSMVANAFGLLSTKLAIQLSNSATRSSRERRRRVFIAPRSSSPHYRAPSCGVPAAGRLDSAALRSDYGRLAL